MRVLHCHLRYRVLRIRWQKVPLSQSEAKQLTYKLRHASYDIYRMESMKRKTNIKAETLMLVTHAENIVRVSVRNSIVSKVKIEGNTDSREYLC